MRTAIIHYWIVAERGGEKVVRALCDLFPDAVIFTHVADAALARRLYPGHEIRTTFIAKLPFARRLYQSYLPLMPLALEELDLCEFDLVLSSESGPAKGVIPQPTAFHLCYCHSPMRYIWDQYHLYRANAGLLARLAMPAFAHGLRQWDVASSARVDEFVANSGFVASRIEKYYRREASVVHPPVDVDGFASIERDGAPDAYLWIGQLTAYKNPDLAVEAFSRLGKRLVVVGDGERLPALKRKAADCVTFLGRADEPTLRRAIARAKALIFPAEEDFGMTPVEAMAAGVPVIALERGGALETVVEGKTGVFFREPTVESLIEAVARFERASNEFDAAALRQHARQFSPESFRMKMRELLRRRGLA